MTVKEHVRDQVISILREWRGIPADSDAAIENDLVDVAVRICNVAEVYCATPAGLIQVPAETMQVAFQPGGKKIKVHLEVAQTQERLQALGQMAPVVAIRGYPGTETGEESEAESNGQMTIEEIAGAEDAVAGEQAEAPALRGARYWDASGSHMLEVRLAIVEPATYKTGYDWDGAPYWMHIAELPDRDTFEAAQGDLDEYARVHGLEAAEDEIPLNPPLKGDLSVDASSDGLDKTDERSQPGEDHEKEQNERDVGGADAGNGKRGMPSPRANHQRRVGKRRA